MNAEPDFNPEDEPQVQRALAGEFSRPAETFQGRELWPYTPGSKNLHAMACSEGDSLAYRVAAFIYIHLPTPPPAPDVKVDMEQDLAANMVPLVWENLNLFRYRVLKFWGELDHQAHLEAYRIARKELNLEALSEIVASPPEIPGAEKKSPATTRPAPRGKSTRRRKR